MHLHRTPKTVGYTSCLRSESNKGLFLELGPFSRKSFSRKNWVGGWGRLDEVIEPSLQLVYSRAQRVVPVEPTPIEVEAYDIDHETSDQVTTKPRGMTRMRTTSKWYVILSWKSCYLPSLSVFLLKIHMYLTALRPSSSSSKVYTLFSYMDPLSDFMASSQFSESGPTIASP